MSPWHASIVVGVDGSFRTVHAGDVRETHDLVYKDGRAYHFREKSPLYDFGEIKVTFEHLYPCGLVIRPINNIETRPSFRVLDMEKLRKLAEVQSPVILRGFAEPSERELFITSGELQEVKDRKRRDRFGNSVTNIEAMPMHYGGKFKSLTKKYSYGNDVKGADGKDIKVQTPPK